MIIYRWFDRRPRALNFNKYSLQRKQNRLVSKGQRNERRVLISGVKLLLALIVFLIFVMAGAGFGMLKGMLDNAPDINGISIKPKGFKTIIYDQNGKEIDTLSTVNSNRIYKYYDEIPEQMVNAFVAIEDERFWQHNGIDAKGILRAAVRLVTTRDASQGASTITQQLIKNHVFNVGMDEKTFMQRLTRKVQEQYLAIELEKRYSKKQIMEYYLNTIYLGQGVSGVEAAANRYFNKSVMDLTLSEIAMIAGITQNPYGYDPVLYPENNAIRRKNVLYKMKELGYITEAEYVAALNDNVYDRVERVATDRQKKSGYNTYYMDAMMFQLRDDFMEIYGMTSSEAWDELYNGGYSVYSVQDMKIQNIVDNTLNNDEEYFAGKDSVALDYQLTLLDADGKTKYNYDHNSMVSYNRVLTGNYKYNNIYPDESKARAAAETYKEMMMEETGASFLAENISFPPQPQVSFTILDQHTGYVKALYGGRGEKKANLGFNRATMAERQPGSTFKVLASFGPYIDTGGCLATSFDDAPYKYKNGIEVHNWYNTYRGVNSLRVAIRDSMNIIAVKAITELTPEVAYNYLINDGFTTIVDHYTASNGDVMSDINQSLALGGITFGVTNLELTAAYASIANLGIYRKPVYYSKVYDHDGNLVIDNTNPDDPKRTHTTMKATTCWQLIQAMRDVVTSGTGKNARMQTGVYNVGKTGTTSEDYDLWFAGMTPYYSASIWYGCDSNVDNGNVNVHQKMWRDIMDQIAEMEGHDTELKWEKPEGVTSVSLCTITNQLPGEECPTVSDYCSSDSIPKTRCGGHEIIEICLDSHYLATNTCPNKAKFAVIMDEDGKKQLVGADFEYEQNAMITPCPTHPAAPEASTINTSAGPGGSITPSTNVELGQDFTVYIAPSVGYSIGDVVVDGVSVGPVSSYTFLQVSEPHTVSVTFVGGPTIPDPPDPPDNPDPPDETGEPE